MTRDDIEKVLLAEEQVLRKHKVRSVALFGSYVRGEHRPDSDVDFLIEVGGPTPPWFPGGLVTELEALLGRCVDVVEPSALREGLRTRVLEESVPL